MLAWHHTPNSMPSPDRGDLFNEYSLKLTQLAHGLPSRFRPTVNRLIHHLPSLFLDDWPMVPNHTDLLENNIRVDPSSGRLVGICDWRDTEVSPFGMSLWDLETMLGISETRGWRYHTNQQILRDLFWEEFYKALRTELDERIEISRLVGILLQNGWQSNDDGDLVPVSQEGNHNLNYLNAVVLGIQGTDIIWND
ncbi:hypothetical protein D9619_010731 [Psilocybe cf. subviscida]|uniref:Aminoglycoside phosphotransferase domain-containing protein n=1 Tax=Psilocybe cf. subviscida TaxID=2480587 RepID=A0A8H5F017_9AGAR|nr:hypothetical protein D9619_010731 [Psilocybe cf. subviscida]